MNNVCMTSCEGNRYGDIHRTKDDATTLCHETCVGGAWGICTGYTSKENVTCFECRDILGLHPDKKEREETEKQKENKKKAYKELSDKYYKEAQFIGEQCNFETYLLLQILKELKK